MLTDTAIRATKPGRKPIKISDAGGLQLLVMPSGSKLWRMAYRFDGRQKQLAFGSYVDVSLKEARAKRDEARKHRANGVDHSMHAKLERIARQATATRCLVPGFDGAVSTQESRDALWARFSTGAPRRLRV